MSSGSPSNGTLVIQNDDDREHDVTLTLRGGGEDRRDTFSIDEGAEIERENYVYSSASLAVSAELDTGETDTAGVRNEVIEVKISEEGTVGVSTVHYD